MFTPRRMRAAPIAAALFSITALMAVLSPAKAAAKAPAGSLTQLHGKGYCAGGSCTNLRGFTKVSGTDYATIPISLKLSANGRTLYAITDDPGAIAILARDPKTGKLAQLPGRLGCISATVRSDCVYLPRLKNSATILVSGDGTQIAISPSGYRIGTSYLYARNPKTGKVRQTAATKTGCIDLLNNGPCPVARKLSGMAVQLSSTTLATYGWVPGNTGYTAGEILLWHRANTKAAWKNTAGTAGCANGNGSASCLKVPCMDSDPTFIMRSADHSKLYVVGGAPDDEDSVESYIATFALSSNGDIKSLLGCSLAGNDSTGQGLVATWAKLNPATGQLRLMLSRGNRGDGIVFSQFAIAGPGTNGAMQAPVATGSKFNSYFEYPVPISLAAGGKSFSWVNGNLDVFSVSKTAIAPFPDPYYHAFTAPISDGGDSGYIASAQVRSSDNRFVYAGLSTGYFAKHKLGAEIEVYKVN